MKRKDRSEFFKYTDFKSAGGTDIGWDGITQIANHIITTHSEEVYGQYTPEGQFHEGIGGPDARTNTHRARKLYFGVEAIPVKPCEHKGVLIPHGLTFEDMCKGKIKCNICGMPMMVKFEPLAEGRV